MRERVTMDPMRRLAPWDRALLVAVLALFGACFLAQLYTGLGPGLHEPPLAARGAAGPDAYPVIVALVIPAHALVQEAQLGDELLRAGSRDLRGASGLEAVVHAIAQQDEQGSLRVVVRRGGELREAEIRTISIFRWSLVAAGLGLAVAGALAFLGGGSSPAPRFFFLACLAYAFHVTWFMGGSPARTLASIGSYGAGVALAGPFAVAALLRFPAEARREGRLHLVWPWLFVSMGVFATSFTFGWPLSPQLGLPLTMVGNVVFCATLVWLLVSGYRRSGPRGRRQLRWVAVGLYLGILPAALAGLLILWRPEWAQLLLLANTALVLVPLGFLLALLRDNAFDVDRLIVATASGSAAVGLLLLAVGAFGLLAGDPLAQATGLPAEASQLAVALACGLAIGPLHRRLRPRVEALFFPARLRFADAAASLRRELVEGTDADEISALLGQRLAELLDPAHCRIWAVREGGLERVFASGEAPGAASSAMELLAWAAPGAALSFEEGGGGSLAADQRPAARKLGLAVLLPVHRGDELALVVTLGAKRSGDVYTSTELAELRAVAERAGVALLRVQSARLRRTEALEREANLAKSRFLAAASHDLRQPLHALGLFVGALGDRIEALDADATGREELAALAGRAGRSAESLRSLFDGVLDVSKLDAGALEPAPQVFRLEELFDELRQELLPQARAKGLLLRVVSTRAAVRSDPLLLARMLRNLLVNAVRYTERGAVLLCARPRGEAVRIEVRDSGPGLTEEEQRSAFAEFRRLEAGRRAGEGLGLGLSIVERLGRLLGHPVSVHSAPGRGSVFAVAVPRADASLALPIARAEPAADAPLTGRLYVIVDDDGAIRDGLCALLETWGCRVASYASVAALRAGLVVLEERPAALLLDHGLGGGETGVDALSVARGVLGPDAPAVLVTGETSPERLAELRELGLPVLTKPVAPARLRALLGALAGRGAAA
jgi:signal transduction histidine kinase/CheY-like chemotaxis protein